MAKVTFLVEGSRAGTIAVPVEIEGENGDRLLDWVMRTFPARNADGSLAAPNPQFSVASYVDELVEFTLRRVVGDEQNAAAAAVPPIEIVKK